jgi:hypothetical protein
MLNVITRNSGRLGCVGDEEEDEEEPQAARMRTGAAKLGTGTTKRNSACTR